MNEREPVRCRDACGAQVPDEQAAQSSAWEWLPIVKAYRCPACTRALEQIRVRAASSLAEGER
jgi:hypothetical protein